jgi:hypothetical protein
MHWKSSQNESEERALIYAIWRILNRENKPQQDSNTGTILCVNLERLLLILLRLPVQNQEPPELSYELSMLTALP